MEDSPRVRWPWVFVLGPFVVPRVYREGRLVVKWDLENRRAMKGAASKKVIRLIEALDTEEML